MTTVSLPSPAFSVADVAGIVDDIGIAAGAAGHAVRAEPAIERVGSGVAGERVGQAVSDAARRRRREDQILDVGAERITDGGEDRVAAFAGDLGHHVAGIVDDIAVAAGAASHCVRPEAAIEDVPGNVAGERVVLPIAGAVDGGDAGQDEVLDIVAKGIGDRSDHLVGAAGTPGTAFSTTTSPASSTI